MKTVEHLKQYYSVYAYHKHDYAKGNWGLAQLLEDSDFVIQKVSRTGLIQIKLPDWYKLKPDKSKLMNRVIATGLDFSLVKIGQYSLYVKG